MMTDQPVDLAALVARRAAELAPSAPAGDPFAPGRHRPGDPLCTSGKILGFPDEATARTALHATQAQDGRAHEGRRPGVVEQSIYECGACGRWHLAATTGAGRRSTFANRKGRRR